MRPRVLFLIALLTLACNRESPTAPRLPFEGPAVFLGRTVDPSGNAVPNVTVRVAALDRVGGTATSGNDGSFRIENLAPGGYNVLLQANGGPEQSGGLIRLLSGLNPQDVLVSTCKVQYGTVRDAATGRPIAGAKVTIFYLDTLTDANGHYQLDFGCEYVPGSTITMTAEHPDYQPSQILTRASFLCTCAYDFHLQHR
jgi:hypothetical protein